MTYEKNCHEVEPLPMILINNAIYSLRSIVIHESTNLEEDGGHIKSNLNTTKGWITCDDSLVSQPSRSPLPLDANQGYLLLFDKVENIPSPLI